METLLEDYKRRLKTASEMLKETDRIAHPIQYVRIETKASCFRTIISELEKYIREKENQDSSPKECVDVPGWLTKEIRELANKTWHSHKDVNDGKRVEAMRIVQRGALDAGYTIGIKKATELLNQYCL